MHILQACVHMLPNISSPKGVRAYAHQNWDICSPKSTKGYFPPNFPKNKLRLTLIRRQHSKEDGRAPKVPPKRHGTLLLTLGGKLYCSRKQYNDTILASTSAADRQGCHGRIKPRPTTHKGRVECYSGASLLLSLSIYGSLLLFCPLFIQGWQSRNVVDPRQMR